MDERACAHARYKVMAVCRMALHRQLALNIQMLLPCLRFVVVFEAKKC
jgi:hypothetical protein